MVIPEMCSHQSNLAFYYIYNKGALKTSSCEVTREGNKTLINLTTLKYHQSEDFDGDENKLRIITSR